MFFFTSFLIIKIKWSVQFCMYYCMYLLTGTFCTETKGPCSSQPCTNRGKCEKRGEKYICMCPEGFTGSSCEVMLEYNYTTLGCQQEQAYGIGKHVRSYFFLLSIFLVNSLLLRRWFTVNVTCKLTRPL